MTVAVPLLQGPQLDALNETYRRAVARKRLRFTVAAAVFFAALVIAAIGPRSICGRFSRISEILSVILIAF